MRIAAATLALAALLAACDDGPASTAAGPAEAPSVIVINAQRQSVTEFTEFVGRVQAIDRVELRARVEGFIKERLYEEGQRVEPGQVLFRIEPDTFEAEVKLTEANVAAAKAREIESDKTLERGKALLTRGNISQQRVDEFQAEADKAAAQVLGREAELRQARTNLSYTEIVTPIQGAAGEEAYSVGNLVSPESGVLAVVTRQDPIYVTFSAPEAGLVRAQRAFAEIGEQASLENLQAVVAPRLRLPTGDDYEFEGWLNFIGTEVDPGTGTVLMRGEFPNPDNILLHGQFVTVVLSRQEPQSKIVVPQSAIQEDQAGPYVLTLNQENQAEIRRIELGQTSGTERVVEQGLEEGEVVVVEGAQKIRPGVAVNPVHQDGENAGDKQS